MKPVITLLLLLFIACTGCQRNVACHTPAFLFTFSGFDSSELSVIIIREYQRGSSFTKMTGTSVTGIAVTANNGDTFRYADLYNHYLNISHDLEVSLPAAQRTFRVRDFLVANKDQKVGTFSTIEESCFNTVSYYLDDKRCVENHAPSSIEFATSFISISK